MNIALSIDFERLSHARAYRELKCAPDISLNLTDITNRLLELFDRTDDRVTFFVVADIADSNPDLIRRIHDAGHEIASHTYSHQLLSSVQDDAREREIRDSKNVLETTIGSRVSGFRAPELDIDDESLRVVDAAGYEYDSSALDAIPIPGFYASWDGLASDEPHEMPFDSGWITEVPVSVHPVFRTPVSGAWVRLLGSRYTHWTLRSLHRRGIVPVTYFHPRAFQEIPKSSGLPRRIYYHTGEWMFELLQSILTQYNSIPIRELTDGTLDYSR